MNKRIFFQLNYVFYLMILFIVFTVPAFANPSTNTSASVIPYTTPDANGNAALDSTTPQLVVTSPTQEVILTVENETINPTINLNTFCTDGTATIPQITINSDLVDIVIPATTVTGGSTWNCIMEAPTTTTITLPEVSGEIRTLGTAIEIGYSEDKLSFIKAVRLVLPDQKDKRAGYSRPNLPFTEITTICGSDNQTTGDALGTDGDCKINSGNDLIIWTRHFTKFATFSSVIITTPTPTSSSTSSPAPTSTSSSLICSVSKPGSAPSLMSATPGNNSVTLTWSKATDPVTKYLVAYGTTADTMQYGNPNVGGPDTTSYTVSSLSGGTTYYFRVKAINGCMPGDFSSALSATPTGITITASNQGASPTGSAENFVPAAEIQNLLFDIALTIDSAVLNKSSDLIARIQFTNFGNVPTAVAMIYSIKDSSGKEVFSETGEITVETEQLLTKDFKNLNLGNGKYTLVLSTTYGDNVKDEFKQSFEVKGIAVVKGSAIIIWIISILIIAGVGGVGSYLFIKRRKKNTADIDK